MNDPAIAVIGAGNLATRRIYPYLGAAGARLVGVCDLDAGKAERNARRFGGAVFTDWETMLDGCRPDGVMICIGPAAHADLAPRILKRGIPVYTEKPPALTSKDALRVARAARGAGVACMTAFKKRYSRATTRAREWIASFEERDLLSISIDYASDAYANRDPASSFLLDFGIHAIDLVGYLFGDVARVFAFCRGPNAYAVSLRFANGAVGSMNLNDGRSFTIPTEEVELTARGGNFMTIHNSSCWRIAGNGRPVEWREPPTFASSGDSGYETGHLAEIEEFVAAIREGRTPRSEICESYKSMALYEAILESAGTGRVVDVRYETI